MTIMRQPSIHDFPWLKDATGIDPAKLGCVMQLVEFTPGLMSRGFEIGIFSESDLYTSEEPERFWIKGDVTSKAHVTLLYGLLTPAYEQTEIIQRLLFDWKAPDWLPIIEFEGFPSPYPPEDPDHDYVCIVARVGDRAGRLAEARGRLEYLPHVNTYPEWKMHVTLAYVHKHAAQRWLDYLNRGAVGASAVTVLKSLIDLGENR